MTAVPGNAASALAIRHVAGTMRLEQAGTIKVFTDVMSGKSNWRGVTSLTCAYNTLG